MGELGSIMAMQGFAGLILFSVFVLMALGLAIIFGQMGVINMAHGEFMILGAYITYLTSQLFTNLPAGAVRVYFFVAIVLAFFASGALGMLVEWALIRHLYRRPLDTLLATWGLSLILQQVYRSVFGAREVGVDQPDWMMGATNLTDTIEIPINGMIVMVLTSSSPSASSADLPHALGQAGARRDAEPGDGRRGRHRHRASRPHHLRHRLRHRRHGRQRLHHDRLDQPDRRPALHRRHVPGGGVRRRAEPDRHHRLGLHHLAGALDARVLPQRLDGAGDRAARGDRAS